MTDTRKRSLVLMTVDCLRADHCGFHGYARPTSPFLDSLACESTVYPNAMVAGAPTYYSLPAILASRRPLALGRDVVGLAPGEDTLATVLQQAGYATAAFTAANPYISRRFGYDQGFEVFRDFHDFEVSAAPAPLAEKSSANEWFRGTLNHWLKKWAQAAGLGNLYDELYFQYRVQIAASSIDNLEAMRKFPSAESVIQSAESWLATLGERPFFLWIHFMDPHAPYYPRPAAFQKLTGRNLSPARARYLNEFWNRSDLAPADFEKHKQEVIDLYDSGIRTVDDQIARLVDTLRRSNRWADCVFALTGDHGEAFLEHGRRYHSPTGLEDEIARVPLLIRAPDPQAAHSPLLFSLLHLAPTLLGILDVPAPASFEGENLWSHFPPGNATDTAVAECVFGCTNPFTAEARLSARLLSVRDARYKLVIRLEPGAVEAIYDLQVDPAEKRPLAGREAPEVRRRLLRIAADHVNKNDSARSADLRMRARLRDIRLELDA